MTNSLHSKIETLKIETNLLIIPSYPIIKFRVFKRIIIITTQAIITMVIVSIAKILPISIKNHRIQWNTIITSNLICSKRISTMITKWYQRLQQLFNQCKTYRISGLRTPLIKYHSNEKIKKQKMKSKSTWYLV